MIYELYEFLKLLRKHEEMISESIPLIASENVTSLAVRICMLSDFQHRYAMGEVGSRVYAGCKYIDEVEKLALEFTKKIFDANYVNVRAISGTVANLAVYTALASCGDKIAAIPVKFGGHTSHFNTAEVRGLRSIELPFEFESFNVDVEKTAELLRRERPKILMLGASVILFPHPVEELAEICNEVGTHLVYDASHVLGLIAGKEFQDPLKEGAEVVTASTHKTFPGPQRAVILGREEYGIEKAVMPSVVSNHHLHSLAAYVVSCMEMIEFGRDYAKQIVKNAKALAESLHELGFKVIGESKGFTESHQVAVDVTEFGGGDKVAKKLERVNVILNKNLLPWDDLSKTENPSGIRIGVQEVTRIGMKEGEMREIAEVMWNAINEKKSEEKIREEVKELKKEFTKVHYSFDESEVYRILENFLNGI